MMKEENALVGAQQQSSQVQWIDSVVQAATTANKLFTRNTCRMCHVYSDKQVEFETQHEGLSSPMASLMMRTTQEASMEVELYRQFLFDEDSVVDNVSHREIPDFLSGQHESDYQRPTQIHQKSSEDEVVSTMTQRTS
jgi:hypothetical protein